MGTWSPDPASLPEGIIVAQFENQPLSATSIIYTPDESDGGSVGGSTPDSPDAAAGGATLPTVIGYSFVFSDEFPQQVIFQGSPASAIVSAPNLFGFFDGKLTMKVNMWDGTIKEYKSWETIETELPSVKGLFEYHPPVPGNVKKYFDVVATLDSGETKTARYGIEVRFDHTPGIAKLQEVTGKLESQLKARLKGV
jgi:hypothetical protein